MTTKVDVTIVGMGIVGVATANELTQHKPDLKILLIDKEAGPASHQTGRNSGVIHSGLYYKPGSMKSKVCQEGKTLLIKFCQAHDIPFEICGKVVVAVNEGEREQLELLMKRSEVNGVKCHYLCSEGLREHEPNVGGVAGLHVPHTGIVNYRTVCQKLLDVGSNNGVQSLFNTTLLKAMPHTSSIIVETTEGAIETDYLINCAGLYSDRVATLTGTEPEARIVPFRGEYYSLRPSAVHLCNNLIYPVPDPRFPFLGVHLTRMIEGGVECGPNAVLAFSREGYRRRNINLKDLSEIVRYSGFRRLAAKHWDSGLREMWRSLSKVAFTRTLQRLVPEVRVSDLKEAHSGVRAQAVEPSGVLVDDFLIQRKGKVINVLNAPSPAATSSFAIAKQIVEHLEVQWELQ